MKDHVTSHVFIKSLGNTQGCFFFMLGLNLEIKEWLQNKIWNLSEIFLPPMLLLKLLTLSSILWQLNQIGNEFIKNYNL